MRRLKRRERPKLALYLRLEKRKVFKICPGRNYKKLKKQSRDTQTVPFKLDKTRKTRFLQVGTKKKRFSFYFFLSEKSHSAEKCKRGFGPLGFINVHSVAKFQKPRRGTLLRH